MMETNEDIVMPKMSAVKEERLDFEEVSGKVNFTNKRNYLKYILDNFLQLNFSTVCWPNSRSRAKGKHHVGEELVPYPKSRGIKVTSKQNWVKNKAIESI